VARDAIEDLQPTWVVLTGIAGGIPDNEFSLGDVLLANSLLDFSITAAREGEQPQLRPAGGSVHPAVERLLACLPAWRNRLGAWNTEEALGCQKPAVSVPDDIQATCYYGADATREVVRNSLKRNFPSSATIRPPLYKIGAVATANVLLKDTELLRKWQESARHISHVEMEAGGVYYAARHARPHELPLLCVRGISDVVGFSRSQEWTLFACNVAASFLHALLSTLPLELFRDSDAEDAFAPPTVGPRIQKSFRRLFNILRETGGRLIAWGVDVLESRSLTTPTLEEIAQSFEKTSSALLSRIVEPSERIPRGEQFVLQEFVSSHEQRVLCLLGSPGSGKTALLALVASNAIEAGTVTLAIKADHVPVDLGFDAWTQKVLALGVNALEAVRAASSRRRVLVIVDQLDSGEYGRLEFRSVERGARFCSRMFAPA
jgi:nucleoside phosphorylase